MATLENDVKVKGDQQGLIFSNLSSYQTDSTQKDYLLPFKDLQLRAQTGDSSAQVLVGLSLWYGWYDCVINGQEGTNWIELAKKQEKNTPAKICAEGLCYQWGKGGIIVKNPEKALECYTSAAKQGYVPALWCLAAMIKSEVHAKDEEIDNSYNIGHEVGRDTSTALKEQKKQATNPDKKDALRKLATQGAEQGFPPSLTHLAYCYTRGYGTPKDYKEAMKFGKMAAQQGEAYAKDLVGVLYYEGLGVTADNAEARKWFKMSADQGYENAKQNLANSQGCCTIL